MRDTFFAKSAAKGVNDTFLRLFVMLGKHGPDGCFERWQVVPEYRQHGLWIDVTKIVVHQNVPEAADLHPGIAT